MKTAHVFINEKGLSLNFISHVCQPITNESVNATSWMWVGGGEEGIFRREEILFRAKFLYNITQSPNISAFYNYHPLGLTLVTGAIINYPGFIQDIFSYIEV